MHENINNEQRCTYTHRIKAMIKVYSSIKCSFEKHNIYTNLQSSDKRTMMKVNIFKKWTNLKQAIFIHWFMECQMSTYSF